MTTNTMDFETAAVSAVRSIQERTGESQIRPLVVDWRRWMTEGVIVGVHISRWRGNVSLRMEDLGMGEELADSEAQEMLLLGKKLVMVPEFKKQFDSLEVRARATIKRYGFATHWGTFVPATAYSEMKAELTALKEQYMELAARYCGEYETHISSMQEIYRRIATRAYERFMRENPAAVAGAAGWANACAAPARWPPAGPSGPARRCRARRAARGWGCRRSPAAAGPGRPGWRA